MSAPNDNDSSSRPNARAPKKTVDEYLDSLDQGLDNWSKLAAGVDDDAARFDFDPNADFDARKPARRPASNATRDDSNDDRSDEDAPSDRPSAPSKPGAYLVSYDDSDKYAEDYETRSSRREGSVWNRGADWSRDGAESAPNGRRYDDRRPYYRNDYRQDYRPNYRQDRRDDYRQGGEYGAPDGSAPRYDGGYREGGYRSNGPRRDGGDYRNYRNDYRNDYRRRPDGAPADRGYSERDYRSRYDADGRRPNGDYRSDNYRPDGDYRPAGRGYYRDDPRGGYRNNYRNYNGGPNPRYANGGRDGGSYERRDDRRSNGDYRPNYDGDRFDQRYDRGFRRRDYRNDSLEPTIGARGKRGEPLSLAEEIAATQGKARVVFSRDPSETDRPDATPLAPESESERVPDAKPTADSNPNDAPRGSLVEAESAAYRRALASDDEAERQEIAELEKLDAAELVAEARRQQLETIDGEKRRDLVVRVLRARLRKNGLMYGEGTLEILPDEFGFLRSPNSRYLSCPDDIYISPSQIRRFGLRDGLTIFGQIRPPKERERYFALLRVESINDEDPNALASKPFFDDLIAERPVERVVLDARTLAARRRENAPAGENAVEAQSAEATPVDVDARILDLVAPFGFGGRCLVFGASGTGKTTLVRKAARAVRDNYPDATVFFLSVDARPEELDELERDLRAANCEVVGSTFEEPSARHTQVATIALEKAKRAVEYGRDVVLFVDSSARLAAAWSAEIAAANPGPRPFDVEAAAAQRLKKYFYSARNVDGSGSLTIVATVDLDDETFGETFFDEFRNAANLEVWLDANLADRGVWPALDLAKTAARRADGFLSADERGRRESFRRAFAEKAPDDAIRALRERAEKAASSDALLNEFDATAESADGGAGAASDSSDSFDSSKNAD